MASAVESVVLGFFRLTPSEVDGVLPALLQFDVREEIEGRHDVEVFLRGVLQGGVELLEHTFEPEVGELVFEPLGVRHARVLLMTKAS